MIGSLVGLYKAGMRIVCKGTAVWRSLGSEPTINNANPSPEIIFPAAKKGWASLGEVKAIPLASFWTWLMVSCCRAVPSLVENKFGMSWRVKGSILWATDVTFRCCLPWRPFFMSRLAPNLACPLSWMCSCNSWWVTQKKGLGLLEPNCFKAGHTCFSFSALVKACVPKVLMAAWILLASSVLGTPLLGSNCSSVSRMTCSSLPKPIGPPDPSRLLQMAKLSCINSKSKPWPKVMRPRWYAKWAMARDPQVCPYRWGKTQDVDETTDFGFQAGFNKSIKGVRLDKEVQARPSKRPTCKTESWTHACTKVQCPATSTKRNRGPDVTTNSDVSPCKRQWSAGVTLRTLIWAAVMDKGSWWTSAFENSQRNFAERPPGGLRLQGNGLGFCEAEVQGKVGEHESETDCWASLGQFGRTWARALTTKLGSPRSWSRIEKTPARLPLACSWSQTTWDSSHFWRPLTCHNLAARRETVPETSPCGSKKVTRTVCESSSNLMRFHPQNSHATAYRLSDGMLVHSWRLSSIVPGQNSTKASARDGSQMVKGAYPALAQEMMLFDLIHWSNCHKPEKE